MKEEKTLQDESSEERAEKFREIIKSKIPPAPRSMGEAIKSGPMYPSSVLDIFRNSNAVFHYTPAQTAIEHILHKKQLKLSSRQNASDPLERFTHELNTSEISASGLVNEQQMLADFDESSRLKREFKEELKLVKQLSFCKNAEIITAMDDLGFMNMRMWDQYADRYEGVCLVFDKDSFVNSDNHQSTVRTTKDQHNFYTTDVVDYVGFLDLDTHELENILNSSLLRKDSPKYHQKMNELFKSFCFTKHKSYSGENEFRICALNDSDQFLGFENKSLLGIIYFTIEKQFRTHTVSDFSQEHLYGYAKSLGVGLYRISLNRRNSQKFEFQTMYQAMKPAY